MKTNTVLSSHRLRELLQYNPLTGIFSWRVSCGNGKQPGSEAGTKSLNGYIKIQIDGRQYLAHRLAWLYENGEWPCKDIDHINRIRHDNRILNLKNVSCRENHNNRSNNTSGFPGVHFRKDTRRWKASIRINGSLIQLGNFETPERASIAYRIAKYWHEGFEQTVQKSRGKSTPLI
nr:MAG TPA: endonuclease [Caudoviricetes sp.]